MSVIVEWLADINLEKKTVKKSEYKSAPKIQKLNTSSTSITDPKVKCKKIHFQKYQMQKFTYWVIQLYSFYF